MNKLIASIILSLVCSSAFAGLFLSFGVGHVEFDDDDFNIETSYLFVRTNLPINNEYKLYLMAGVTHVELQNYTLAGFSRELKSQSGNGYGIGLQIPMKENNAYFAIEYVNYLDEDEFDGEPVDVTVDALNLRFTYYY